MRTSLMLTRQISGGRGVCGAHKLIPMPLRISRAPGRPRYHRAERDGSTGRLNQTGTHRNPRRQTNEVVLVGVSGGGGAENELRVTPRRIP